VLWGVEVVARRGENRPGLADVLDEVVGEVEIERRSPGLLGCDPVNVEAAVVAKRVALCLLEHWACQDLVA